MSDKRAQAMHMYLNESCTQRHIATTLGVSERTIYTWIRQNSWDRLKQASLAAPVIIADNLCFQLIAMQQSIAEREPGKQFPTMQEAEVTRKLVMCIDKLKRYPSLTQSMQVLETFRQYVKAGNEKDSWPIERWMGKFMEARAKGGFRPNDIEYNAENLTPFGLPFDEEVINDIPATIPTESITTFTSDQPEILPETDARRIENQSVTCLREPRRTLTDTSDSRKQSEVKSEAAHMFASNKNLKISNFKSAQILQSINPENHGSDKIFHPQPGSSINSDQPEIAPPNTPLPFENQHITPTSDHPKSRK